MSKMPQAPNFTTPPHNHIKTRDYDTMHRGKGNLTGIEKRRALNPAIVGGLKKSAENNKKDAVHPDMLSSGEEVGLERIMFI